MHLKKRFVFLILDEDVPSPDTYLILQTTGKAIKPTMTYRPFAVEGEVSLATNPWCHFIKGMPKSWLVGYALVQHHSICKVF